MDRDKFESRLRARLGLMAALEREISTIVMVPEMDSEKARENFERALTLPKVEVIDPIIVKPSGKAARRQRREIERQLKHKKK